MKKFSLKILTFFLIFAFFPFSSKADDEDFEAGILWSNFYQVLEVSSKSSEVPNINARHAIVLDRKSKLPIFGKSENEICKMASTTKIMTSLVVIENANLDDVVIISSNSARIGGSRLGLSKNDKITVKNLLYGLMLKSGNDAAIALAEHVGGNIENFATMMNKKVKELNLKSTNFVTPHGLDDDRHFTTAYDLAILTDYALQNSTFAEIVKTKTYTININGYAKTISNTNELLGNFEGLYGVKTGFTNGANRCLVTSCKKKDLDVICVVLGCDTKKDRTKDSICLLNYIFNNFTLIDVKDIIVKNFDTWSLEHSDSFSINKGRSQNLSLLLDENDFVFTNIAINKKDVEKINTDVSFFSYFEAPLSSNTKIGEIALRINDINYFSVDILNNNFVLKKNCFDYVLYIFKNYCSFFKTNFSIEQ